MKKATLGFLGGYLEMQERTKKFYNAELEATGIYTEVFELEKVQVREIKDIIVKHHYWKDEDGEFWVDFGDPTENLRVDFAAYRKRKGYITPEEIKKLREDTGLTVRVFANYLGMGSSTLSQLENNQRVQTKEQDALLQLVDAYFIKNQVLPVLGVEDLVSTLSINLKKGSKVSKPEYTYQTQEYSVSAHVYDKDSLIVKGVAA